MKEGYSLRILNNSKINPFLVSMIMLAILLCYSSQVQAVESEDYTYTVTDGEAQITKYIGAGGSVTIPSILGGFPVTRIGDWAFSDCIDLTTISIPESVISIGVMAFRSTGLTSVTIPDSVTSIGDWVFADCTGLTSVNVGPENIAYSSMNGILYDKLETTLICYPARKLDTSFIIPDSVSNIYSKAFFDCTDLTNVTIPNSVSSIGDWAFSNCTNLLSVSIPDSVTNIGGWAFEFTGLKSVTIPNGVTRIGQGAFRGCNSLTSVSIPDSVTSLGDDIPSSWESAFSYCTNLSSFEVGSENIAYSSMDGVLYNKSKTTLICYPPGKLDTSFSIPNSVTKVFSSAFIHCTDLTSMTIPDSVTKIGESAFGGCTGLTSIIIPNSVTDLWDFAFAGCTSLTSVTISEGLTSIGRETFFQCNSLTSVTIPNSVTSIGSNAFSYCSSLASVSISSSVTRIDNSAFSPCSKLTALDVASENIAYSSAAGILFDHSKATLICYPAGRVDLSYTIPDSINSIGEGAFGGCTSLKSVNIPNSVTTIGGLSFYNCSNLTNVIIPNSVTSIGRASFSGCTSLTGVTIPNSVTSIEEEAFSNCTNLTSLTIPNSVISIGYGAFRSCANLTEAKFFGNAPSMESYAFDNCSQNFKVKYLYGKTGFTDPWYEYPTEPFYIVTYYGNGSTSGTVPPDSNTYLQGDSVTLLGNTEGLAKTGYTFAGWNTISNGSGTNYAANSTFNMGTTNVTLYAKWTAVGTIAAPVLQSATTDNSGTQIILTFSKVMANPGSSAEAYNVSVSRNGATPASQSVAKTGLGSNSLQIILSLAQPLLAGDIVFVSYIPGTLTSADGGILDSFNNQPVTNQAPQPLTISENNTPITVSAGQTNLAITSDTIVSAGNNPVAINVPSGVSNTTLNIASLLQTPLSGTVTSNALPSLAISAAVDLNSTGIPVNVQVQIPQGTMVSAPEGWDGTIHVPAVQATNSVTVTPSNGSTATVNSVIEVGFGDVPLTFNQAVRLLIPGQAGKKAGYVRSGTFYPISTVLSADDQSTANSTLTSGQDAYLNVGSDLVIWTKHFTRFVTYSETTYTPTPTPTPTVSNVQRLFGQTRVDTALAIAKANYTGTLSNVILATADDYPDALTGSVLAYKLNAPILLVGSSDTDQAKVLDYMKSNLDPAGTVYILGGTGVVSSALEGKITAVGFPNITRLGGADRYETSVKIAEQLKVKTGTPIVLAYGENYPDALSISSLAAEMQYPILLVQKDGLSDAVKNEISALKPSKVYIIGGEGVISTAVESQVAQVTSLSKTNIVRIAGKDRYETSLAVAQYFNLSGNVCVATGSNFPDALAGSVYAATHNAPIILADGSLSDQVMNYLKGKKLTGATLFGGEAVVSKDIEQQLRQLMGK